MWDDDSVDNGWHELGNCFKTGEEAKAVAEKIKIYTQLKRLAEEINTEPVDWRKTYTTKYKICYDWDNESLFLDTNSCLQQIGTIYSTNKDFLGIAKERIGEENLLKLFKE